MTILVKYIAVCLVVFISTAYCHNIHISYGEAALTEYEISGKVTFYKDDFMSALKNNWGSSFKYFNNNNYDELKLRYLQKHFIVIVNGNKILPLKITGNNENESTIWFNFKFISNEKIESLEINNKILINEFSDQMNLFNLKAALGDRGFIFNKSKQKFTIKY